MDQNKKNILRLMKKDKFDDRIIAVMSAVFELPADEINDESSPDSIDSWDSLRHMNLVMALEEEFEKEFADDEILEMVNYKLIQEIIISS